MCCVRTGCFDRADVLKLGLGMLAATIVVVVLALPYWAYLGLRCWEGRQVQLAAASAIRLTFSCHEAMVPTGVSHALYLLIAPPSATSQSIRAVREDVLSASNGIKAT